jgi:hypothetical protein
MAQTAFTMQLFEFIDGIRIEADNKQHAKQEAEYKKQLAKAK